MRASALLAAVFVLGAAVLASDSDVWWQCSGTTPSFQTTIDAVMGDWYVLELWGLANLTTFELCTTLSFTHLRWVNSTTSSVKLDLATTLIPIGFDFNFSEPAYLKKASPNEFITENGKYALRVVYISPDDFFAKFDICRNSFPYTVVHLHLSRSVDRTDHFGLGGTAYCNITTPAEVITRNNSLCH